MLANTRTWPAWPGDTRVTAQVRVRLTLALVAFLVKMGLLCFWSMVDRVKLINWMWLLVRPRCLRTVRTLLVLVVGTFVAEPDRLISIYKLTLPLFSLRVGRVRVSSR